MQYPLPRYYDPATQQFLTVDPLLAQTEQAYAYAGGSPTNATDPSGNEANGICINFGAAGMPLMPNSGASGGHNKYLVKKGG